MRDLNNKDLLRQAKSHVMWECGPRGYGFWKSLIVNDPILLCHPKDSGIEIEVSSHWDRATPSGAIRVVVSLFEMEPKPDPSGVTTSRVPTTSFLVFEDEHIDPLDEGDGRQEKQEKEPA
jgi:hypothetical protein